ncbi:YadA family autotransporter adhesin [Lysobacter soli]|uniref:YadA family autotransporter adhesin n=1 Tax=Lysobacter soli TaxID=453783 RepID=UPI0036BE5A62
MIDAKLPAVATGTTMLKSTSLRSGMLGAAVTSSLTPDQLIASGKTDKIDQIQVEGEDAIAMGLNTHAVGDHTVAVGGTVSVTGPAGVGVGDTVAVSGTSGVAIGTHVSALADNAVAIGNAGTNVQGEGGVAIGRNTEIGTAGVDALAIGNNIASWGQNSITLGNNSTDDGVANVVSVGSADIQRKIVHVAAGTDNTDAANFGQLKATAQSVANALGGTGGGINADGTIKKPKYKVAGVDQDGIGAAISALDARSTTLTTDALQWDAAANGGLGAYSAKHGTQTTSKIANVAMGTADTDAVNVKQLNDKISNLPTNPNAVSYDGATKDKLTLAGPAYNAVEGTGGTRITNVANATQASDAVNLGQLQKAGIFDPTGAPLDAVVYNKDSNKGAVTFGGTTFNSTNNTGGTRLTNVATATADSDAVNLKQLNDRVSGFTQLGSKVKYIKFGATSAPDAQATGTNAVAIGGNSFASSAGAMAIGANANVTGLNSVAVGFGSQATEANTFAVGSKTGKRRIVNVADGTATTDAVTLGQVNKLIDAKFAPAAQSALKATLQRSGMLGAAVTSSLPPEELIASGTTDKAGQIQAEGEDALAIGLNTHAANDHAVAVGGAVSVTGIGAVGVGETVAVSGTEAVAVGNHIGSLSASLAGLHTQDRAAVGTGVVNGEVALSVGYQHAISDSANFTLGGAFTQDDQSVGAAVGFGW